MKIRNILLSAMTATLLLGCYKEETPESKFNYEGPTPALSMGDSEAEELCRELYEKYDFHVYCTLSGDDAERTGVDYVQTNPIISNNADCLPMVAADLSSAAKFLKLLTKFYEMMPEYALQRNMLKRNILIKGNPASKNVYSYDLFYYYHAYTETQQGVAYFGDIDDAKVPPIEAWKREIALTILGGYTYIYTRDPAVSLPAGFGEYSQLWYSNGEGHTNPWIAYEPESSIWPQLEGWGFVHYRGFRATATSPTADISTYAAWIVYTTKAEREVSYANNPVIKTKAEVVAKWYMDTYQIDLEKMSTTWTAVTTY